jgi:hypothetical protein
MASARRATEPRARGWFQPAAAVATGGAATIHHHTVWIFAL